MISFKSIAAFLIVLTTAFLVQACASSGGLAANKGTKEFSYDYEKMKEVVKQAIKASNMNINYVDESDDSHEMIFVVGRDRYMGNEQVQHEQGEVRLFKLDKERVRLQVDNPEYHYSIPSHQKEDYQRLIFSRVDRILEKENSANA